VVCVVCLLFGGKRKCGVFSRIIEVAMEGFGFDSSHESPLTISQEEFERLLDSNFNIDGSEEFFHEMSQEMAAPVQVQSSRCSLPATTDWPGDYGFNVTFGQTDAADIKNIHWIYRKGERKLYINKDVPCPVNFSVSVPLLLPGALVRAMAVYTTPQHANESVRRCITHSMEEIEAHVFEAEHLIRSECPGAMYHQQENTKRHSVTVPFENPPAGQCFSTYIYKFACRSSCAGGPNRRPLTLVFTLEQNNVVIGRCSIHLRICANPARDSGATTTKKEPLAKKIKVDCQQQVSVPKRKMEEKESFTVETSDSECHKFLLHARNMHRMNRKMRNIPIEAVYWLASIMSSSEDDFSSVEQ
ncbi:hypothetical protein JTE90_017169, partial [Oedothorax gibbosus]